jgi:hypothetical protein
LTIEWGEVFIFKMKKAHIQQKIEWLEKDIFQYKTNIMIAERKIRKFKKELEEKENGNKHTNTNTKHRNS